MSKELEQPRFRIGETANRPYGGNVSDAPFPRALYCLAVKSGFESQSALAKAIGSKPNTVSGWYRGEKVPSPERFGNFLILTNSSEEEREPLVAAYANRLAEQEASSRLKLSGRFMQPSNNPFGKWTEDFCHERAMTIAKFKEMLAISPRSSRRNHGRETIELIRQNAKDKLKLSEEQTASLNEAIDKEIQQRTEEGHKFQSGLRGRQLVKGQEKLNYRTYNGKQAGEILEISRERVRRLRNNFNLPVLLTNEHIEMLRGHLEKTKDRREKLQRTRMDRCSRITLQS